MAKAKKERIDKLLVELGLAADTGEAARFLMAGLVVADEHRVDKPGAMVRTDSSVRLKYHIPYVSRGGLKLEKALSVFNISFHGKTVIDIGASTGGFSDVALQNGASKVYCVDVGRGQLDPKIQHDKRVTVLDSTDFRKITFSDIGEKADIIIGDVSFISLEKILERCAEFAEKTECVFLIKPQFEAKPGEVDKGGIVSDKDVHERVIAEVTGYASAYGFFTHGLTVSPVKGAKGNVEYLAYFVYNEVADGADIKEIIRQVVYEEYSYCSQASR